jgi:hypothetical protein
MAKVDELHSQIDQGKTAILLYKDGDKDIKVSIRQNNRGQYIRNISSPDGPSLFPQPDALFNAWKHLLEDLHNDLLTSDQWYLE